MKDLLCKIIAGEIAGTNVQDISALLEVPPEKEMGDLALPCFGFAKILKKSPKIIAEELTEKLGKKKNELGLEQIRAVNGYLNFYFVREKFVKQVMETLGRQDFGIENIGNEKVICMDYSSPNIAKNFHVGHLRTTIIGNSIYKIYSKLGYNVIRINHLGDWGTQFGKLIAAYFKWSSKELVEEKGIEELLRIYVKFNEEASKDESLIEEARQWFVKMEQNDEQALEIWNRFKDISMAEFSRVYELLGVSFDFYTGESFYRDKVPALVAKLNEKHLLSESAGAKVIDLSQYGMPPCLILKNDGGTIYHSRDIAAVLYRKETYHFEKCLYVTGLEQALHFKQVFKAIELMGYDWYDELHHIPYGLVSLDGQKLSTRTGNIIYAEDILNEAIERAFNLIQEKNPSLSNKEKVSKQVGIGAVIFHDLFNQRIKNIDFVWDDVLNFEGSTGSYVQYTYARAKSILRKCQDETPSKEINYNLLTDDRSYDLVKAIGEYHSAVVEAAKRYEPCIIARFLIKVSGCFNKFYHDCSILQAEPKLKTARLALVEITQKVIKDACSLLGMECPEEM